MKPSNNVELITSLMEFSDSGAMAQLVVVESLNRYVRKVTDLSPEEFLKQWRDANGGTDGFINPEAWRRTCLEIREKMDAFYGGSKSENAA